MGHFRCTDLNANQNVYGHFMLVMISWFLCSYVSGGTIVDVDYAVTGLKQGNIFRYINHSCDPNLYVQPTLRTHTDRKMPDIALFTLRDVRQFEELSYDYGRYSSPCFLNSTHTPLVASLQAA